MSDQQQISADTTSIKAARSALRNQVKNRRNGIPAEDRARKSAQICAELLGVLDKALLSSKRPFNLGVYSAFAEEVDLDLLVRGAFDRGVTVSFPCMMHDAHGLPGACEQTMEFRAVNPSLYEATKRTLGEAGSTRKTALVDGEEGVPFLLHPLRKYHHDSPELAEVPYVAADELDMLVCPCVAFDAKGNRLGYGAGNYDRYLAQLVGAKGGLRAEESTTRMSAPVGKADDLASELDVRTKAETAGLPGEVGHLAGHVAGGTVVVGVAFEEQQVENIPVEPHDIPLPFVSA